MTIDYTLKKGAHESREAGMSAMEWVAYLAGEDHTEQPQCVSPALRRFCIKLNDNFDDEMRQKLRPYLTRCIGTADDGRDTERGYLCLDWQVRTFLPAWLRLAGLTEEAERVEALAPITNLDAAKAAGPVVREARAKGAAARDAAWGAAVRDAAGVAAWAAAVWRAAWDATWNAARAATWDAARDWDVGAVGAAAGDAAWDAAWAAAARAAAQDADGDALKPTVRELQESALRLLDRMLPTEAVELPEPMQAEYERLLVA